MPRKIEPELPVNLSPVLSRPFRSNYSLSNQQRTASDSDPEPLSEFWNKAMPHCGAGASSKLLKSVPYHSDSDSFDGRHIRLSRREIKQRTYPSNSISNTCATCGNHNQMVHGSRSNASPTDNLRRMKNSVLGHSDPQLNLLSSSHSQTSLASSSESRVRNCSSRSVNAVRRLLPMRRSLNVNHSSSSVHGCRSPAFLSSCCNSMKMKNFLTDVHSRSHPLSSRTLSSDARRWSLASLPSSSGCGTSDNFSVFSSEFSSIERLAEAMNDAHIVPRADSPEVFPLTCESPLNLRPRSRSLTNQSKFGIDYLANAAVGSSIFNERFPKAKQQMEERLQHFLEENAPLSGTPSFNFRFSEGANSSKPPEKSSEQLRLSKSPNHDVATDFPPINYLSNGFTRFIHHQIVEIASDCILKSREGQINCAYFFDVSRRLEQTLADAKGNVPMDGEEYLYKLVQRILMIISRTARLMECLEFNPNEFYHMLESTEDAVREQLGVTNIRVPDLPQYILTKLGLNKDSSKNLGENLSVEIPQDLNTSIESNTSCVSTKLPCEEDFETIRLISNGAYGAVFLVKHKESCERFSLKKLKKQMLIMRNQIEQVYAERDILTFTDNPFVVSFHGSFETRIHLCILMEYVEGGDCAALLKSVGTLPVDISKLYIAETVLAIDYLHSCGIVHRDLKPDNLLITAMGHIKLTDFGLSKIGLMNRTNLLCEHYADPANIQLFKDKQLCGTPEYIAPEVILRQGYGKPVDWWALGIILYEFLVGIVPFLGDSPEELFTSIVNDEVEYPADGEALLPEAEALIARLLQKNPLMRLGTVAGAEELMEQKFFVGLDFDSLLRRKAEFIPQLANSDDSSYFDLRSDRYNHDAESGDDDSAPMFGSFDTASLRHSIVGFDCLLDQSNQSTRTEQVQLDTDGSANHGKVSYAHETCSSHDLSNESAVLLRRLFSNQRIHDQSTSSSGTNGSGCINTTCSSDSSFDASFFPDPWTYTSSHLPRFAISCEPDQPSASTSDKKELSPVNESKTIENVGAALSEDDKRKNCLSAVVFRNVQPRPQSAESSLPATHHLQCVQCVGSPANVPSLSEGGQGQLLISSSAKDHLPALRSQSSRASHIIRKGSQGFGFGIRSIRIYLSEKSEYYKIEHIVSSVEDWSPAFNSGLHVNDLITHINGQPASNLTNPQFIHRLLTAGNELLLKVVPMSCMPYHGRHCSGKLIKRKPRRLQRRIPMEKNQRKVSLLRRLSGKRMNADFIPGTSSQKQAFMPRSVSNQDGIQAGLTLSVHGSQPLSTAALSHSLLKRSHENRLSKEEIRSLGSKSHLASGSINRPSTLQGSPHKAKAEQRRRLSVALPIPVSPLANSLHTAVSPLARRDNASRSPPRSRSPTCVPLK